MIPFAAVLANALYFIVAGAIFRAICFLIGFHPYPLRDLFALTFGYLWGGIGLRYLLNAKTKEQKTAPDSKSAWEDGRIQP